MSGWVVDASVAAKWFFDEALTENARVLLATGGTLLAPDLIVVEVANVAWKRALRGEVTEEHARSVGKALPQILSRLIPVAELHEEALSLALRLRHPVCECVYLALAQARELPFVTADARLLERLQCEGWPGEAVPLLSASPLPG